MAGGVADELTQESMLLVWRKAALFDAGKGSLSAWLLTISRNCLLNHIQRAGRRHRKPTAADESACARQRRQQLIERAGAG